MMPVPNRILVALEPIDFRKQIDGLASACEVCEQQRHFALHALSNRHVHLLSAKLGSRPRTHPIGRRLQDLLPSFARLAHPDLIIIRGYNSIDLHVLGGGGGIYTRH